MREEMTLSPTATVLGEKENWKRIPMYRVHKNRLSPDSKRLFNEAWRNQEGYCLISNKLLKKAKCIFGLYETPDKDKFDGLDKIPFIVSDEYLKSNKKEVYYQIDRVFRDIFEYDGLSKEIMDDVLDIIKPLEGEITLQDVNLEDSSTATVYNEEENKKD